MRQDAAAWNEGYRAGLCRRRAAVRPYPVGATKSWSWSSGYIEGNAARLKNRQGSLDGNPEH